MYGFYCFRLLSLHPLTVLITMILISMKVLRFYQAPTEEPAGTALLLSLAAVSSVFHDSINTYTFKVPTGF